jgi:hypothetical protein
MDLERHSTRSDYRYVIKSNPTQAYLLTTMCLRPHLEAEWHELSFDLRTLLPRSERTRKARADAN